MELTDFVITKIVEVIFWAMKCPKCGYINSKDNLKEVCPVCMTSLRIGKLEDIEL